MTVKNIELELSKIKNKNLKVYMHYTVFDPDCNFGYGDDKDKLEEVTGIDIVKDPKQHNSNKYSTNEISKGPIVCFNI